MTKESILLTWLEESLLKLLSPTLTKFTGLELNSSNSKSELESLYLSGGLLFYRVKKRLILREANSYFETLDFRYCQSNCCFVIKVAISNCDSTLLETFANTLDRVLLKQHENLVILDKVVLSILKILVKYKSKVLV